MLGVDPQVLQILAFAEEVLLQILEELRQMLLGLPLNHVISLHDEDGPRAVAEVAVLLLAVVESAVVVVFFLLQGVVLVGGMEIRFVQSLGVLGILLRSSQRVVPDLSLVNLLRFLILLMLPVLAQALVESRLRV